MTPNSAALVGFGLGVWLLTYLWFLEMGVETVALLIRLLLGAIPVLGLVACVGVGIREWRENGPWPWAVPALVLAVVLGVLMSAGKGPVHEHTGELRKVGAKLAGTKADPSALGSIFLHLLLALSIGLIFAGVGAAGAWGGYQLAYGSWIVGALLGAVVLVAYVLNKVAFPRARWNIVHRGGEVLKRLRQEAVAAEG